MNPGSMGMTQPARPVWQACRATAIADRAGRRNDGHGMAKETIESLREQMMKSVRE